MDHGFIPLRVFLVVLSLLLCLESFDLSLELRVALGRGVVRGFLLGGFFHDVLVLLEERLSKLGEIDDGADVASGARVLGLGHVAHGKVWDPDGLHEREEVPVELQRADGFLVELGEFEAVRRSFEIRRVHLLARLPAEEDDEVLVHLEQGVGVRPEELLLRDGDVQLGEARDDVVVAQDGERVRRRHGEVVSSLRCAFDFERFYPSLRREGVYRRRALGSPRGVTCGRSTVVRTRAVGVAFSHGRCGARWTMRRSRRGRLEEYSSASNGRLVSARGARQ